MHIPLKRQVCGIHVLLSYWIIDPEWSVGGAVGREQVTTVPWNIRLRSEDSRLPSGFWHMAIRRSAPQLRAAQSGRLGDDNGKLETVPTSLIRPLLH